MASTDECPRSIRKGGVRPSTHPSGPGLRACTLVLLLIICDMMNRTASANLANARTTPIALAGSGSLGGALHQWKTLLSWRTP